MPDDQEFKIRIVSSADNSGFVSAGTATKELTASTAGAADATKRFKIDASDLSDETKRSLGILPALKSAHEEAGHAAEESGISHRELRKTLLDIGNVAAPGAGDALMELAGGPVGVALALVGAYELLKHKLEADEEEADKLAEALNQPMDGGAASVESAWDNAAKRMGDYFAKMATAGQDNDPEATQLKRIKELTDAEINSAKTIVQALAEVQEAHLKANGGTPEDIAAVKTRTAATLAALDQQKDHQNGVGLLQKEQNDRLAQTQDLYRKTKETSDAARTAERKYNQDQATLKNAREALEGKGEQGAALKKQQEEAQKKMEAAQALPTGPVGFGSNGQVLVPDLHVREDAIKQAQEELDKVQRERDRLNKVVTQLGPEGNEVAREAALKQEQKAAEDAAAADEKNKARLRELPGEIDQAQKVEGINNAGNNTSRVLKDAASTIAGDAAAGNGSHDAAVRQLKESQRVGQELALAAAEAAASHSQSLGVIQQALRDLTLAHNQLAQKIGSMPTIVR